MRQQIFAAIVAIVFTYIASPLILPLAMGGVLAVLFSPWLIRLERREGVNCFSILPFNLSDYRAPDSTDFGTPFFHRQDGILPA